MGLLSRIQCTGRLKVQGAALNYCAPALLPSMNSQQAALGHASICESFPIARTLTLT